MATREEIRYRLQRKLTEIVGEDEAAELMAQSPPVPWADVATKADLAELRGELREMRGEMREMRGELLERIGALDGRIGALDGRIGALDGRIGALDGRIGAQTWRMYGASFVSAFSTAGLVLAVARLA